MTQYCNNFEIINSFCHFIVRNMLSPKKRFKINEKKNTGRHNAIRNILLAC